MSYAFVEILISLNSKQSSFETHGKLTMQIAKLRFAT